MALFFTVVPEDFKYDSALHYLVRCFARDLRASYGMSRSDSAIIPCLSSRLHLILVLWTLLDILAHIIP